MKPTYDEMIAMYHRLKDAKPEESVNACVVSPEMKERILRIKGFDHDKVASFFGVKVFTHPYLGNIMVYGNEKELQKWGFIK